ncbi:MAG: histidine--tRNA ligase [Candidatus Micrarchaeia archaeon]
MADYSAPKGMRDFLPDEMEKREWAIETIKAAYRKFGFSPMDTPALETVEVLEKKCGDEIKGQLFRVDDGRLALRFDLTVPLSRVASSNTFKKPFKRYCVAPVWRREEPQKGRFREFYQADADIIGCQSVRAEAELISCACEALNSLGFSGATVKINDRRLISSIASGILPDKESALLRLLDKKGKITREKMMEEFEELLDDDEIETREPIEKFATFLDSVESVTSNKQKLELAREYSPEAADDLKQIISLVSQYDKSLKLEIDFSLVRGLDYYTGAIFEIKLSDDIGSVAGGGRYDGLLAMYGQGDSAVGISLGIERLLYLMKEKKMPKKGVFVASVKEEFYIYSLEVAAKLRAAGIAVQTDLNERNLKKQMEFASNACAWIVVIGEKEQKEKKITLRNLESGKEELLTVEEATKKIKAN